MPNSSFLNHTRRISTVLRPLLPRHLHFTSSSPSSISSRITISNSNSNSNSPICPYYYHHFFGYRRSASQDTVSDNEIECHTKSGDAFVDIVEERTAKLTLLVHNENEEEVVSTEKNDRHRSVDNVEEWKAKLRLLVHNENEEEVVSTEKNDRCHFKHISAVASEMGLYSRQYERTVVFSKVPLPNYRPDLDNRRPQRVVDLDPIVQERVEYHLKEYLYGKSGNGKCNDQVVNQVNDMSEELQDWQGDLFGFTQRIINKKNLQMRKRQQDWQRSCEGQKMIEFRKSLPAHKQRETLLTAVSQNQVVVVSGETGCGKTTQLPQYILESEIEADRGATCNIICTQPRRISAISVSERVAAERGENLGESVGFKVRLEGMRGRDTRLLFCTTGILLRRLLSDRELEGVTHVIIDEIHERGINEDFLLIVLKDLLPRKPDLRVVLMSATLNAELFSSYLGNAPMIHIPGLTFPVQTYFLENILELTGYKLTPDNQIDSYGDNKQWKMQRQLFKRKRKTQIATLVEDSLEAANFREFNRETQESLSCWNADSIGFNLIEHILCHICKNENPGAVLVFLTGWDDINTLKDQLKRNTILGDPNRVCLLACHGSMSSQEQKLIFNHPKDGIRKIVLATNIAETSITINDVVFVVDCGKAKESSYDALNRIPCLVPSWISKASAKQRRGRAGRVQAGVCYHLYPRCVHEAFSEYQLPHILRTPLHSLCLQIKTLQLASISEFLNKALQPPEPLSVNNAIEYLKAIGVFDENENLTVLGHRLSMIPVEPKLGKMLVYGAIFNCLDPILTVVACLSDRDPFVLQFDKTDDVESAKVKLSAHDFSDHLALVRAYDGWKEAERTQSGNEYCWNNFLSSQTLRTIDAVRMQFIDVLMGIGVVDDVETCNMWSHDYDLICSIICAGLFPGICSVVNKEKKILLKTMEDGPVVLVTSSVNSTPPEIPQPWIVFNEKVKVNSVFIRDSTAVSDSMVLLFGGSISAARLEEKYGHLTMLGGYFDVFTRRSLADTYLILKRELNEFIRMKLVNPNMSIGNYRELLSAVRFLVREDQSKGKSVFDYEPEKDLEAGGLLANGGGDNNSKTELETVLASAGHPPPTYTTVQSKNNNFISLVRFNGFNFTGQPCSNEKDAEKSAACKALVWLTDEAQSWKKTSGRRTLLESAATQSGDSGHRQIVGLGDGIEEGGQTSQIISGLLSLLEAEK